MENAEYNEDHLKDPRRAGKITASVAAACMGENPYMSRQKAWRLIKGVEKSKQDNYHLERGRDLESSAVYGFECESGLITRKSGFIVHPWVPWLGASPDALALYEGEWLPVEVKCPMKFREEIPHQYWVQVQVQMSCMEVRRGFFYDYMGSDGTKLHLVEFNQKWWDETALPVLKQFYEEYVLKNVQPPRKDRKNGNKKV